jgi:hypothetical protein
VLGRRGGGGGGIKQQSTRPYKVKNTNVQTHKTHIHTQHTTHNRHTHIYTHTHKHTHTHAHAHAHTPARAPPGGHLHARRVLEGVLPGGERVQLLQRPRSLSFGGGD